MTDYILMILMDIPEELDERFNHLYDTDHLPNMLQVPAVRRCDRYRLAFSDAPDMQRYLAIYEIDDPEAPRSELWKRQAGLGAWPTEMRPFVRNRSNGVFERIGRQGATTDDGPGATINFLQLGIDPSHEERFNHLYDTDHLPLMLQVPGARACTRYRLLGSDTAGVPGYLAIYGIADAGVPRSQAWKDQAAKGAWPTEIRPHLTGRRSGIYGRL